MIEQGLAAYGASGRNAGMLSETVDHGHGLAIEHFGETEARRLAALGEANVAELTAFLAERDIRCDYEPTGRLMVALDRRRISTRRRARWRRPGGSGLDSFHLLDRAAVQAEVHSPLYLGGVAVTGGGHPRSGQAGGRPSRRGGTAGRPGVRAQPSHGGRAAGRRRRGSAPRPGGHGPGRVVLATSAYTHHLLPSVTRRFIPLYDYILVSDPLTPAQREAIGWRRRQGITDGRTFFNYYRLTATTGFCGARARRPTTRATGSTASCDHSPAHYAALRASFRRHFPGARRAGVSRMPGAGRSARPPG